MERSGIIETRLLGLWLRSGAFTQAVVAALVYYGSAKLATLVAAPAQSDLLPFWPASGLLLAGFLLTPRARWAAISAGALVGMAAFNFGAQGPFVTAAFEVADLLAPLLAAVVVLRLCGGPPDLARLRDTTVLIVAGALVTPMLSATIAAGALSSGSGAAFGRAWVIWALSNIGGVLLVTPLVLSWARGRAPGGRRFALGLAALTAGTTLLAALLFFGTQVPLAWIALTLPAAAALRGGVAAASVAVLPWVLLALVATTQGHGVYAASTGSMTDALMYAQASTSTGVLVCVALGSVAAQLSRALRSLRTSEENVRLLVEGVRDHAMFMVDGEARIASWNAGAQRMLGHRGDEVLGRPLELLLCTTPGRGPDRLDLASAAEQERWVRRADGSSFLGRFAAYPVRESDPGGGDLAVVLRDVTEATRAERELRHMALHDSLTGLPNRSLLQDRLEVALSHSRREHSGVAVLFCDLDRFKVINDSLGHEQGDEALRQAATRLRSLVRPGDTVARFGGDEFVLCCQGVDGAAEAVQIAGRVQAELRRPMLVGEEVVVGASVGIALARKDSSPDDLIRGADSAMYRAKQRGGGHALVNESDRTRALGRLRGEAEIRHALERGELDLHYQPIVDLASGRAVAVEALLRWNHPDRGLLSPAEFIRLAEDTGAIVEIGAWAIETACNAGHRLREQAKAPEMRMNVNLSARQLLHDGFVERVGAALGRTGTHPRTLCLELTETTLIEDLPENQAVLTGLKRLGVRIAMDDFGTGYSSLAYLRRLPIDQLKLDRSFVTEIEEDGVDAPVLRAAVAMAEALDVELVAEGVESLQQGSVLESLGYQLAQGFYFARPMHEAAMAEWLREARPPEGARRLRVVSGR